MWRVRTSGHPKPCVLISFAILVVLAICFSGLVELESQVLISGILCFVLEKNWFSSIGWTTKIPLYSVLGISVTFALLFSIIDLINYGCTCCQDENSKPLIETETQVPRVFVSRVFSPEFLRSGLPARCIRACDGVHVRSHFWAA